MVEVGQLQVAGSLDTGNISQGFNKVKQDFKVVENQANQTNVSLSRMKSTGKMLAKTLGAAGLAGATALTALATKSPMLAGTFAKIDVSLLKLSNTVGRQLQPVFEGFNNLIGNFNSFISGGSGGSADSIFKGAMFGGGAGAIAGGIIGFMLGGPAGIMIGASLGSTIGAVAGGAAPVVADALSQLNEDRKSDDYQSFTSQVDDIPLSTSYKAKALTADVFTEFLSMLGGLINLFNKKETDISTANGVSR
jgi:hypothetical protein